MKYGSLSCPHCGSKKYQMVEDEVFLCEYCNQKFSFDLDNINLDTEDSVFIEELKEEFSKKTNELYYEKKKNYDSLLYYKNLVSQKKLWYLAISGFVVSIMFIFVTAFSLLLLIPSAILVYFAKKKQKELSLKYAEKITYYASKVADCERKIAYYINLQSRLTK